MNIRRLDLAQVDSVLQLWCEYWAEAAASGPAPDERERLRRVLEGYSTHPRVCCFLHEQAGEVTAFVTASLSSHPVMEGLVGTVEELYVRPAFRRKGIGTELVEAAVSFLAQQGAGVLKTHACIESSVAQAFWHSLGWEADTATFSLYDL